MFYLQLVNKKNPIVFMDTRRKLEKGFQKKPIVAFTNSTVFILDFNIRLSLFGLMFWPWVLSQTIPDCIKYIIGVFCYKGIHTSQKLYRITQA